MEHVGRSGVEHHALHPILLFHEEGADPRSGTAPPAQESGRVELGQEPLHCRGRAAKRRVPVG
eukprot:7686325-Lingulodinium_polyedra.AAC.1